MLSLDNIDDLDLSYEENKYINQRSHHYKKHHKTRKLTKTKKRRKKRLKRTKKHKLHKLQSHEHKKSESCDDEVCAVCLEDKDVNCQLLPCNHKFHGNCIAQWVERNFSCPLCRQEIGQFIPLKGADNELMDRFEQLWINHYSKQTTSEDSDKEGSATDSNKSQQKIIELDVETVIEEISSEIDVPIKQPIIQIEIEEEVVIPSVVRENVSIWKRVWNEFIISSKNTIGLNLSQPTSDISSLVSVLDINQLYLDTITTNIESNNNSFIPSNMNTSSHYYIPPLNKVIIPRNVVEINNENSNSESQTINNFYSGMLAGFSAGIISQFPKSNSVFAKNNLRMGSNLFSSNIASVALFFTGYEYLKEHLFNTNPRIKSSTTTAKERFISAGIAGSIASSIVPNSSRIIGLRFAAFFTCFELFKDFKSESINYNRLLNLNEVASSAFFGGLIASSLYYPTSKLLDIKPKVVLSSSGSINLTSVHSLNMKQVSSGFIRHVTHFLPACVTCSCAFEFSRRYLNGKD